jgi:uncharacterized protein YceK
MDFTAIKPLPKEVSMRGVLLAILLLASGCGGVSLRQLGQACQASNDTHSAQCADYWGKGQQNEAAAVTAKDMPPAAVLGPQESGQKRGLEITQGGC